MGQRQRNYHRAFKSMLAEHYNWRCAYCGTSLNYKQVLIDHVDPNGPDEVANYLPSCRPCNSRKGIRSLERFRELMACRMVMDRHPETKFTYATALWLSQQPWYPWDQQEYVFYFERVQDRRRVEDS
jgi:hypothetical protein